MFARALLAFLACPGIVAILIPAVWLGFSSHTEVAQPIGLLSLAAGLAGLLWCVRDFYVAGRGTLAPWSPPKNLVTIGLYEYSRNPMYVAVVLILVGWSVTFAFRSLAVYALVIAVVFHLRVVFGEEPWLARTHGEEWTRYAARVPRWLW